MNHLWMKVKKTMTRAQKELAKAGWRNTCLDIIILGCLKNHPRAGIQTIKALKKNVIEFI